MQHKVLKFGNNLWAEQSVKYFFLYFACEAFANYKLSNCNVVKNESKFFAIITPVKTKNKTVFLGQRRF